MIGGLYGCNLPLFSDKLSQADSISPFTTISHWLDEYYIPILQSVERAKVALKMERIPVCLECNDMESVLVQFSSDLSKIHRLMIQGAPSKSALNNAHSRLRHYLRILRQNCEDFIVDPEWSHRKRTLCLEMYTLEHAVVRHINFVQCEE
ncbi:MAG: hypothetical protein RL577_751 [Bacteroidota bacterium]